MAGIDTELRMREMAAGGNPQAAQQRYAQSQNLIDLLVAQKVSNDYASARNAMQAATQAPAGTVKDQLDMSNEQVTRNDMMRSIMPGVQMKAARDSQAMQRRNMGVPSQPAPNIRMADGGIVGYEDGGIIDRILNFFRRNPEDAPDAEEVRRVMSEYGLDSGYANPNLRRIGRTPRDTVGNRNMGFMVAMPELPEPPRKRTAETGPPTRAEKFSQMFPKVREAVNRGNGSAMGGLRYLQMVGRMQEAAKEEEAQNAANYIKMLARSQDMIDEVDPANTPPPEIAFFDNGGGVERRRTARNLRRGRSNVVEEEPRRIGRGRVLSGIGAGGDPVTDSLGQMGRNRKPEPEVMAEEVAVAPTPVQPKDEQEFITDPSLGDVLLQLQTGPVRPQDRAEPEEKKGILDNLDIGRLQAFLAGGAGQRSTAEALGGGLRGLMAEDQRRQTLASDEAIEAAKIAAERFGIEQDYDAEIAKLGFDREKMVFDAQTDMLVKQFEASADAAKAAMGRVEQSIEYQTRSAPLLKEFKDNPERLSAELAAVAADIARKDADIQSMLRGAGGGFEFPDLGTDED